MRLLYCGFSFWMLLAVGEVELKRQEPAGEVRRVHGLLVVVTAGQSSGPAETEWSPHARIMVAIHGSGGVRV